MRAAPIRRWWAAALSAALCGAWPPPAHATDIQVTLGSLPSAQGWTYVSDGVAAAEGSVWTLSIGLLSFDTMPYAFGAPGVGTTSFYSPPGVANAVDPVSIKLRGR